MMISSLKVTLLCALFTTPALRAVTTAYDSAAEWKSKSDGSATNPSFNSEFQFEFDSSQEYLNPANFKVLHKENMTIEGGLNTRLFDADPTTLAIDLGEGGKKVVGYELRQADRSPKPVFEVIDPAPASPALLYEVKGPAAVELYLKTSDGKLNSKRKIKAKPGYMNIQGFLFGKIVGIDVMDEATKLKSNSFSIKLENKQNAGDPGLVVGDVALKIELQAICVMINGGNCLNGREDASLFPFPDGSLKMDITDLMLPENRISQYLSFIPYRLYTEDWEGDQASYLKLVKGTYSGGFSVVFRLS